MSDANIHLKDGRCHRGQKECLDGECLCYNGGKSYYLRYQETRHTGVVNFTCLMRFESGHNVIGIKDSIAIQIIDVDGPFIKSMLGSSLIAGTRTTLMCTVNTTVIGYDITLTCLNKNVSNVSCSSCFPSIEIDLRSELTGDVCICSFKWNELMIYETLVLKIKSPPVVVHAYMVHGLYTVLTIFCYSVSKINETKWYFFEELLENCSENVQAMTEELVPFPIFNENAKIRVHVINLTMSAPKSGLYTVVISNRYGEIKHQFQLKKDIDGFNLSAIIWGLSAIGIFLVTFSVSTTVVRGCVTNAASIIHNAPVIYHAAPYFGSEVHSYDITGPEYDDCDVSMSGSLDRRKNHNVDIQLHNSESSCIYEEIK